MVRIVQDRNLPIKCLSLKLLNFPPLSEAALKLHPMCMPDYQYVGTFYKHLIYGYFPKINIGYQGTRDTAYK